MKPALVALALMASACGRELTGAERGAELFASPDLSPSPLNVLSCADCHSIEPGEGPTDGLPGYRMYGVAGRVSYWGGEYVTMREAVEACLRFFMRGEAIADDDADAHALYEYLLELSPAEAPTEAYSFTVVENVADVARGDAERGEQVYRLACQGCHGEAFTADGSILRETVHLPGVTSTYPTDFPGVDPSLVVIEKVRHGRFFDIGGDMPLFTIEAMSDDDLGALLSYLEL